MKGHSQKNVRRRRPILSTGLVVIALGVGIAGCSPQPAAEHVAESAVKSGAAKNIGKGAGGTAIGGGTCVAAVC